MVVADARLDGMQDRAGGNGSVAAVGVSELARVKHDNVGLEVPETHSFALLEVCSISVQA